MYNTITNQNDDNHTPLPNANIREAINQVMLVEKVEANNFTVDTLITQINESDNIINKVANWTINDTGNYSNGATASDVPVQFAGNSAVIYHQTLLSGRMIGIRHEEVPVLVPPMEPSIIANNQPAMNVSTGVIQAPQDLKTPTLQ